MHPESNRIEYKETLNDKLERSVVAFLNYREGGQIYIGIGDDGKIAGLKDADRMQLKIVDRIKNNILPSTLGLFDVVLERIEGKNVIKINISSGTEKPYYIKEKGMSEAGCFIRVGSSVQAMPSKMIDTLFQKRNRIVSLGKMKAPRRDLTFRELKIYYNEKGFELTERFRDSLEFVTEDGADNYVAYLLADENGVSMKVAKYSGTDKVDLIENEEYGYCCLIKAANRILDKLTVENKTFAKITPARRLEKNMVNKVALREAVINAIVHNDYSSGVSPLIEIFSDRITVTSYGGLVEGMTQDDFFACYSKPRNRELMRVFHDLELVEQIGSGMSRILRSYDRSVFKFTPNFMTVSFPVGEGLDGNDGNINGNDGNINGNDGNINGNDGNMNNAKILKVISADPYAKLDEIVEQTDISKRTVSREIKKMQETGLIRRVGSRKTGYWEITLQ